METNQSGNCKRKTCVEKYFVWQDEVTREVWYLKELINLPGNYVKLNSFVCSPLTHQRVELTSISKKLLQSPDLPGIYHVVS